MPRGQKREAAEEQDRVSTKVLKSDPAAATVSNATGGFDSDSDDHSSSSANSQTWDMDSSNTESTSNTEMDTLPLDSAEYSKVEAEFMKQLDHQKAAKSNVKAKKTKAKEVKTKMRFKAYFHTLITFLFFAGEGSQGQEGERGQGDQG